MHLGQWQVGTKEPPAPCACCNQEHARLEKHEIGAQAAAAACACCQATHCGMTSASVSQPAPHAMHVAELCRLQDGPENYRIRLPVAADVHVGCP